MPTSVKDRFANSWEYLFMFVKSKKYFFDLDAVREPHKTHENRPAGIVRDRVFDYNSKTKILTNRKGSNPRDYDRFKLGGFGNVPGHPKGKNPDDIILTKHDEAVGRIGDFAYSDPLHAKEYHPKGKNPGDFWDVTTRPFKGAHFAVFPEKLVERPIKVTPREICNKCGKPKVRKIIGGNPNAFNIRVRDVKEKRIKHTDRKASEKEVQDYNEKNYVSEQKEIIESCNCKAGFHPAIILDIFAGSGTTLKVARDWGRDATGIEIKPEYCKIIKKRLYGRSKSSPNEFKLVR